MKKKLIIMMIVIILIIIVLLFGILFFIKTNNEEVTSGKKEQEVEYVQSTVKPINSNIQLFTVQSYIQSFIEQINVNNVIYYTGGEKIEQSIISKWTYSLLSTEYIEKYSITEDNVYDYVSKIEEKLIFVPLKINVLEGKNNIKYAIYGFTQTQTNEYKEELYFILNVDNINKTYSVEPVFGVESIDEIKLSEDDLVIEVNRYNSYKEKNISDEYICEQYLSMYKRLVLANTQESYNYLNEEYRNEKFNSLENYINYVTKNKSKIAQILLEAYSIDDDKYILQDQWGNYYIFNIKGALDYDVILDTYTIDLPEFIEKYNNANSQEKVVLNINKIITALNAKDYKYIYSKLADSFKNNYFQNEEVLTEYLESNLFDNNEVEFEEFSQEGTIYTYKIKVTKIISEDEEERYYGKNAPSQYMNIVMQLNEGTDFIMSFSIEE